MRTATIVPIVEGPGEVEAAPLLLRRLCERKEYWNIKVDRPINAHGIGNITKVNGLEGYLEVAARRNECNGILVLLDAEGDCSKEVAKNLAERAKQHSPHLSTVVVAAKHHYENWFLGSAETIAGKRGLKQNLELIDNPESIPDPKRWLTDRMVQGKAYRETLDQAPLSQAIDIELVRQRSRSFRRFEHALEQLLDSILSGQPSITP